MNLPLRMMMERRIKIVIIDDEKKIVNLIKTLIDWDTLPLILKGTAHDGVEALSLIEETSPEIVILDIRMPGLNGIELIERLTTLGKDTHFLIISGYRHFEYAHKAIKYGVEDYLLKPIKKIELNRTLKKIIAKIGISPKKPLPDERGTRVSNKEQATFLEDIFLAGKTPSPLDWISHISSNLIEENFRIGLIKNDHNSLSLNKNEEDLLSSKTLSTIEMFFDNTPIHYQCIETEKGFFILFNYRDDRIVFLRQRLLNCLEYLRSLTEIFETLVTTIGLSEPFKKEDEIQQRLSDVVTKIQDRILSGAGTFLSAPTDYGKKKHLKGLLRISEKIELARYIEILNTPSFSALVKNILRENFKNPAMTCLGVLHLMEEIDATFTLNFINYHGLSENPDNFKVFIHTLSGFSNVESLIPVFINRLETTMMDQVQVKQYKDEYPIKIAKKYIQDNFYNPISLEEISDLTAMNSSYFSSLFKKKTGMGFLEYLTHVRMEEAKNLLENPQRSISDTASEVGYKDSKHFTKQFKRHVGLSPSEYRKLYY
jgi:two-component system, response regulator YesN